jgi:hypothetical protein
LELERDKGRCSDVFISRWAKPGHSLCRLAGLEEAPALHSGEGSEASADVCCILDEHCTSMIILS